MLHDLSLLIITSAQERNMLLFSLYVFEKQEEILMQKKDQINYYEGKYQFKTI